MSAELTDLVSYEELERFEIKRDTRGHAKPTPEWIANRDLFRKVIFSHPQAPRFAARWTAVAYWYWPCGMAAHEIGKNLGITTSRVYRILENLRARGKQVLDESG